MTATHYIRSNGSMALIAEMQYPHLRSAVAKLRREEPHRTHEIEAMDAEISRRDADTAGAQ